MTDIDAIRKRASERVNTVMASQDRRALLSAYDAKCERVAELERLRDVNRGVEKLLREHCERLEAERDAAVRDAIGLRAALRKYGEHDRTCQHRQYLGLEFGLKAVCSCGYEAALAPPTEQPTVAT